MGQVAIPDECLGLAAKNSVNSVLSNKDEMIKAKARLVWLRAKHPFDREIKRCDQKVNELIKLYYAR